MHFRHISILGVGLLGGSVGMAAKAFVKDVLVTGYGHRTKTLETALEIGAIDRTATTVADAVKDADLVILCTPVGIFPNILSELSQVILPGTVVTDVGSTKRSVVELAEANLPRKVHFVGSHPMAGSEKRGVEFAKPDLFQNALCITTPTPRTDRKALEGVEAFWKSLGMRLTRVSPEDHDRLLADISHLPHAVAAALVAMQDDAGLPLAGKGFLDTTRIAGGDGALWRDILLDNRDNLRASLDRLKKQLTQFQKLLTSKRGDELTEWLNRAAGRREDLLRQKLREVNPD